VGLLVGVRSDHDHLGRPSFGLLPTDRLGAVAGSITYEYDAFDRRTGSSEESGIEMLYDGLDRRDPRIEGSDCFEYAYVGTSELLSREADQPGGSATARMKRYDFDSQGRHQGRTIVDDPVHPARIRATVEL
jgi:hypothetical protein